MCRLNVLLEHQVHAYWLAACLLPAAFCHVPRASCISIVEHSPLTNEEAFFISHGSDMCVNRKQLQLLLVALATPPALSCLPACLHLHLFSNQISNEIFIKLINISAGLSQASLLRYTAVDASNACAAAPADVPASAADAVRLATPQVCTWHNSCSSQKLATHSHISDSRRR